MDLGATYLLVAGGAAATAVAAVLWALRVSDGARGAEGRWRSKANAAEDKLQRWDSLMGAFPGVALVWEPDPAAVLVPPAAPGATEQPWGEPKIYGSPFALASLLRFADAGVGDNPAVRILQGLAGFKGRDSAGADAYIAPALTRLRREGEPFSLTFSSSSGMFVEVDGRTAGPRAVVWILDSSAKGAADGAAQLGRSEDVRRAIARDPAAFLEMLTRAPFLAWRVSAQGRLEWANDAYITALDAKSLEQAVSRNLLIDSRTADQARRAIESGGETEEIRHIVVQGDRRAFRVLMFPVAGAVGAMAFDVTDVETARDERDRIVQAHDATLDALTEAVVVFGPDRRVMFHNRAFSSLFNLDPAFLAEKPTHAAWLDLLKERRRLPAHANYPEWRANELLAYQEMADLPETLWQLPEGKTLRVARRRHPLGGLLLIFSDITTETVLKSRYASLHQVQRAALDKLHEGVVVFGLDGRMQLRNAAFDAIWRIDPLDMEGEVDIERLIDLCTPLFHETETWARLKGRITDPSPDARQEDRGEMRRSDGSIVSFISRPLPDGATLVAFLDVTATRRVEEALRDRAEAFEAADRLKTEFVENVSYHLRTPLQTIQGYAEVLAKLMAGPLNDRQRDVIQMVLAGADNLSHLVDSVLEVAMIEAGRLELDLTDVPVQDLVTEAATLAAPKAREQDVRVDIAVAPGVGRIKADGARLRQALANLLSNALRFTEKGDVVTIGAERRDGMVRLFVADTGRGIPYEDQAGAFDHFVSHDRRGAGLGLALVRSFVELHDGWVSLESEPGRGTTVNCYIPAPDLQKAA
ncbi:MAG: HAMP domain-containing histidine kinase [Alphaproteobacteria bacterium]|nr:HAMP domain-containing histidine kinase [Alphaproteobacteria bacterium]